MLYCSKLIKEMTISNQLFDFLAKRKKTVVKKNTLEETCHLSETK